MKKKSNKTNKQKPRKYLSDEKRKEPQEILIFQELAEEEMPGKEMERDQPKTLKTSADNGVTDAKGIPTGTATCLFQTRKWDLGSDSAGIHCLPICCALPTGPGPHRD